MTESWPDVNLTRVILVKQQRAGHCRNQKVRVELLDVG